MPQFLLSVWHDQAYEVDFSTPEAQRMVAQVGQFNADLESAGAWVHAGGLQPAATAHVARAKPGAGAEEAEVRPGPYLEAEAQMGGFWIIEAQDLDSALAWGRRAAAACEGSVEVRPLQGA